MSARALAGILTMAVVLYVAPSPAMADANDTSTDTATATPPLEARMTAEQWRAAGLHKLSAEELKALNTWLRGTQAAVTPPAAPPVRKRDAPVISARIPGEFKGWKGNTVFRLDNGQVWRQRVGGRYRARPALTDPEVVIEKGAFGYYLKVIEADRSIGVKRVR